VLHHGTQRRDDRDRLRRGVRAPQREEALMHRAGGCGPDLIGHRLALREREHALLAEPGRELGTPASRAILGRRDHDDGAPCDVDERGPREGARARGRIGDLGRATALETFGELAEALASIRQREDAAETRRRPERRRASH
jgi:hypothetical protein